MGKHFADGILLNQFTVADNRHAVADSFNHIHLVRDQQNGQTQTTVNVFQQFENGSRGGRIQCAGRFVAQQYFRLACQRTGDGDTLLLTTRQVCRVAVVLIPQADEIEQFRHATLNLFFRGVVEFQRQRDVTKNGSGGQQVKVLENHADLATRFGQITDLNTPFSRALQQVYTADQRTFTCA